MRMEYPEDFKQRVLTVFEGMPHISEMLETGNEYLGWCLSDSGVDGNISVEEIMEAIESGNQEALEALYNKAKKISAVKELYKRWNELHDAQIKRFHNNTK